MLVAQLSDPHIRVGPLAGEAASQLHRALGRALGLRPRPDCVLITGDLVDDGSPAAYEAFGAVLANYPLPIHLLAGNHDDVSAMLSVFGGSDYLAGGESPYYAMEYPGLMIVALNTSVPGEMSGRLGSEQLDWLDGVLAASADTPTFVCLHHPPIETGIKFLDGIRLEDAEALAAVLSRHLNVRRVLAGHVHRAVIGSFAGITVAIAPSTVRQAVLDLATSDPTGYAYEPAGFLLHHNTPTGCVSHLVPVQDGPVGYF